MPSRRSADPALSAVRQWLRSIAAGGVTIDPVLAVALEDTARAVDRARATDEDGKRLAYIARELRAARQDVIALMPTAEPVDPFARLLAEIQMADAEESRASD